MGEIGRCDGADQISNTEFDNSADNAGVDADNQFALFHDILGEMTQPNARSRFVTQVIVSDGLPEVTDCGRFHIRADLGQSHRVPRGYSALWGIRESGKDRFGFLIDFPEVGKRRLKDECAGKADDVDRAAGHGVLGPRARFETAGQHQWLGCHRAGALREFDEVRSASRAVGGGLCSWEISPPSDVDQIDRRAVQCRHHLERVLRAKPAHELVRGIEFQGDWESRSDSGAGCLDGIEQKSHAIVDCPAVFVAPLIEQWGEELTEQKSVRRVNLHTAETSPAVLAKAEGN